jgi:DNA (cytosine-5)-methyltransferase 1
MEQPRWISILRPLSRKFNGVFAERNVPCRALAPDLGMFQIETVGCTLSLTQEPISGNPVLHKNMIKAIDFFCGAGGLTRGLLDAGIEVLAGVDIDCRLRETYEKNNSSAQFISADIKKVSIKALRRKLGIRKEDLVLYGACTPCQPFSTLNRSADTDKRKNILISFGRIVMEAPPDFLLVENVPGLNTAYGKNIYERFLEIIERCGFRNQYSGFLDAKDFGVPQVRRRFILLASRKGTILPPRPISRLVTVRDSIASYPPLKDGECSASFHNHVARHLQPHLKRIVVAVPKNGGSRKDISDKSILLKCHRDRPKTHKDVFGRIDWDRPAPTLTGRCTDVYCGRFTHPEQDRGLSLREAAALQTFPDNYVFFGTFFHIAHQIGNAVPVRFAASLGEAIAQAAEACQWRGAEK